MSEELKQKIMSSKVVSFDIFDTLIVRMVGRPETVFDIIGKHFSIPDFRNIRMSMQSELGLKLIADKNYPHANIDEIYDYIKDNTDIENTKEIMNYELKLEKELLVQNKKIFEVYKFCKENKKRVVATSDMYLYVDFIKDILDSCGYKDIDKIYLSSDKRKAKFTGELFDVLIDEEKVGASEILHIGDNYKDDYKIAGDKGLNVYHYKDTLCDKKTDDIALSFHYGIKRLISLDTDNFWEKVGANAGLLYFGIYKELLNNTKDKIYFLARDGYNLYNIFKKFSKKREVEYVYTSRRAMLLGSINTLDLDNLNLLPPFTYGQTIEEVLKYICLDKVFTEDDLKKVGFSSFSDVIMSDDDIDNMRKLYLLEEDKVLDVFKKEREYAKKYFLSIGMLDKDNYVFDCGWNGSSQYLLNKLFLTFDKKIENKFYYVGLFDNPKSRKQLENLDFDSYAFGFYKNKDIADKLKHNAAIVELFFGANHNSVLKYTKDGYILDNLDKSFDIKDNILSGLMIYMEYAISLFDKYDVEFDSVTAISPLLEMISHPTEEEAINIGNLTNVDGFVHQEGEEKHLAFVTREQIEKNKDCEIYWPQAVLCRSDIDDDIKDYVRRRYGLFEEEEKENLGYIDRLKLSIKKNGYRTTLYLLNKKIKEKLLKLDDYNMFLKRQKTFIKERDLEYRPLISFVVPVYNAIETQLVECIQSVFKQTYSNWELILVDDASTLPETHEVLKRYENKDKIKIKYHEKNEHISKTTNDGIELASGEFIALLDNDDVLDKNALLEMVIKLNEDDYDFIYSDEDKLSEDGKVLHDPFFKPDYSKDTFMSLMYTCHFSIFRKSIALEIGGFTVGLEGAQDYDFVLRFTEVTQRIGHVPKILYHWREREGSIASDPKAKEYALNSIVKLKEDYLKRNNLKGKVIYEKSVFQYRVLYEAKEKSVDAIISFSNVSNTVNLIKQLEKENSKALNKINILVDDVVDDIKNNSFLKKYNIFRKEDFVKVKDSSKELLLFISDNITVNDNFIDILGGHAILDYVGMVGSKILYKDSTVIYSCGLTGQYPFHILMDEDDSIPHYYCRNRLDYNTLAVSPMCMMIKKKLVSNLDFLDSISNTIKFGKEIYDKGYFSVIRNDALSYINIESVEDSEEVVERVYDPFINSNLSLVGFKIDNLKDKYVKVKNIKEEIEDKIPLIYKIDYSLTKEDLLFEGFVFSKNIIHNNSNKVSIILKSKDNMYLLKTYKHFGTFVSKKYQNNYNFTNFVVRVKNKNIKHGNYQVLIDIDNNIDKVRTRKVIIDKINL